jgi:adenine-specific DNA-methyltransferase
LQDKLRGPISGFVYNRRQNKKGEEVGGIVPHVTLKSLANNEPPEEEVLVDRPEENSSITRVTGPFSFEATIPTPLDFEEQKPEAAAFQKEAEVSFVDRMLEVFASLPFSGSKATGQSRSRTFGHQRRRSHFLQRRWCLTERRSQ